MRIWILSDLHLSNRAARDLIPIADRAPHADLCIIAGDTADGSIEQSLLWMAETIGAQMPVVTVLGNHDFFGGSIYGVRARARRAAADLGVHLLDDGLVELDGTRFIGATLWTDYTIYANEPGGPSVREFMAVAKNSLPDTYEIDLLDGDPLSFTPSHARELHANSRRYLESTLGTPYPGPTVVVTHHAPHPRSISAQFVGDPCTPAFVSDLSQVIEDHQPDLWVHGHTHDKFDYRVGKSRVVCNARGFSREESGFRANLVIDI